MNNNMTTNKKNIWNLLEQLLASENVKDFLIIREEKSGKFVQFVTKEGGVIFDLPSEMLTSEEMERATAVLATYGIQLKEVKLYDRPGGRIVKVKHSFRAHLGDSVDQAGEITWRFFMDICQFAPNFSMIVEESGFFRSPNVDVTFYDVETGQVFAQSNMPPENLPETFELNTTMYLGDEDWTVVSAEPMSASEFLKTGKLRLILRKVRVMDPAKILYSLPSICNFLGEVDEEFETIGSEYAIHEDNWRNIELFSLTYEKEAVANLREIYRIHQEQRVEYGFREMHLRDKIEQPFLSISLPLSELDKFKKVRTFSGLSYLGNKKLVINGFAFTTIGGITWYGRQKSNLVQELCVATCLPNAQIEHDIKILTRIMDKYRLGFVDWIRVFFVNANEENDLKSYFLQAHSGRKNA